MAQGKLWRLVASRRAVQAAYPIVGGDGQAIGPLPAGVAEGSCQVLHRENRLPVPGGVGAVNTVPVNGYELKRHANLVTFGELKIGELFR